MWETQANRTPDSYVFELHSSSIFLEPYFLRSDSGIEIQLIREWSAHSNLVLHWQWHDHRNETRGRIVIGKVDRNQYIGLGALVFIV